jgi:hypothetical protein
MFCTTCYDIIKQLQLATPASTPAFSVTPASTPAFSVPPTPTPALSVLAPTPVPTPPALSVLALALAPVTSKTIPYYVGTEPQENGKWRAVVYTDIDYIVIGEYATELEAALVYDEHIKINHEGEGLISNKDAGLL